MSLSMDKAIRGATKPKRAAPKKKYLDVLIPATARDDTLETMFMSLDYRMKETSWTVVFKSLIVIHILMRCGKNDKVLSYLVRYSGLLNVSSFKDKSGFHHGGEQVKNIHTYAIYLEEKVAVYRELKTDFIKIANEENGGRLKRLTVAKGLLREVKILQRQLETLLNCKFYVDEINNDITLLAFNLLVKDLLSLFKVVNEGVINVLDQYFEMSKIDAKEALQIYKKFCKETERVVDYLGAAKKVPHLGVSIPNLKHAPTSLTVSLEEYVNDPDFEINRQQYKHAKEQAKAQKTQGSSTKPVENKPSDSKPKDDSSVASTTPLPTSSNKIQPKENNDFIDFFASLEQEHTVIFNNYRNTGTNTLGASSFRYSTNPFLTMQTQNQGTQSPIQQNSNQQNLQNMFTTEYTNPFRSSVYVQDPAPISQDVVPYQNPFLKSSSPITNTSNPFNSFSMDSGATFQHQLPQQTIQPSITPITPVASSNTDNNPFRRLSMSPGFASQQTQLTVFSQSLHSQDSSTSSFQSTSSTLSQNQFSSYSGF